MKSENNGMRTVLAFSLVGATVLVGVMTRSWLLAAVLFFVAGAAYANPAQAMGRLCITLTAQEILLDVIRAFAIRVPGLKASGMDLRTSGIKLNKQYTAHISTIPTVRDYDATTGYLANAASARDHLVDVDITVTKHRHVPLKWPYLNRIADDKQVYDKVIANAGYALARDFTMDIAAEFNAVNFSQESIFTEANSDVDMLVDVAGDMNLVGAMTEGRIMLVNTPVAGVLSGDQRMSSRDYEGQMVKGSSRRRWVDTQGFALIEEWPELPLNNGTALTGVTGEADDEIFTKVAHGLVTGQRVILTAVTGGTGLTAGNVYYAIRLDADTFNLATTAALAQAGTEVAFTTDVTDATITPSNNLTAMAYTPEAMAILAGPPEPNDDAMMAMLGIPKIMGWTEAVTDPDSGVTMAAVSWQAVGTNDLYWSPVLLWGKALGRQAGTNAVGAKCDYAGHRIAKV